MLIYSRENFDYYFVLLLSNLLFYQFECLNFDFLFFLLTSISHLRQEKVNVAGIQWHVAKIGPTSNYTENKQDIKLYFEWPASFIILLQHPTFLFYQLEHPIIIFSI
jgi:hypothetical protein